MQRPRVVARAVARPAVAAAHGVPKAAGHPAGASQPNELEAAEVPPKHPLALASAYDDANASFEESVGGTPRRLTRRLAGACTAHASAGGVWFSRLSKAC